MVKSNMRSATDPANEDEDFELTESKEEVALMSTMSTAVVLAYEGLARTAREARQKADELRSELDSQYAKCQDLDEKLKSARAAHAAQAEHRRVGEKKAEEKFDAERTALRADRRAAEEKLEGERKALADQLKATKSEAAKACAETAKACTERRVAKENERAIRHEQAALRATVVDLQDDLGAAREAHQAEREARQMEVADLKDDLGSEREAHQAEREARKMDREAHDKVARAYQAATRAAAEAGEGGLRAVKEAEAKAARELGAQLGDARTAHEAEMRALRSALEEARRETDEARCAQREVSRRAMGTPLWATVNCPEHVQKISGKWSENDCEIDRNIWHVPETAKK